MSTWGQKSEKKVSGTCVLSWKVIVKVWCRCSRFKPEMFVFNQKVWGEQMNCKLGPTSRENIVLPKSSDKIIGCGVTYRDERFVAWTSANMARLSREASTSLRKVPSEERYECIIRTITGKNHPDFDQKILTDVSRPFIHKFRNGDLLLCGVSLRQDIDEEETQGVIYRGGVEVERLSLGRKAEFVVVDAADRIWVTHDYTILYGEQFTAPNLSKPQKIGNYSPLCFDREGRICLEWMPWAARGDTEVGIDTMSVSTDEKNVFLDVVPKRGLYRAGATGPTQLIGVELPAHGHIFALQDQFALQLCTVSQDEFRLGLRLVDMGGDVPTEMACFDIPDAWRKPRVTVYFGGHHGRIHIVGEDGVWLTYSIEDAKNQFLRGVGRRR